MAVTRFGSLVVTVTILFTHVAIAQLENLSLNLGWPELSGSGVITQNGGILSGPDDAFPCASMAVPDWLPRTAFPASGFRPQYNVRNLTAGQDQYTGWYWISDAYIGQISSDVYANKSSWAYLTTDVFRGVTSGPQCGTEIDVTRFVNQPAPYLNLLSDNLVGANVTLGLRVTLFDADGNNYAEQYQCSYISFVAANTPVKSDGICNSNTNYSPSSSASSASPTSSVGQAVPTSTSTGGDSATTATTVPSNQSVSNAGTGSSHNTAKIVGIAVPIGVVGLLIVVGIFIFIQRRRRNNSSGKKRKPTIALDFFVRGHPNEHKTPEVQAMELKDKKDKLKEDEDNTDRTSVNSEPLPVYKQTAEEEKDMERGL